MRAGRGLVAQQLFQLLPRGLFSRARVFLRDPLAANEFKILAEVSNVFFRHRLGAAIAALISHTRIVAHTIQAHLQVRTALVTRLAASGQAGAREFPAALMAMTSHVAVPFRHWKMSR